MTTRSVAGKMGRGGKTERKQLRLSTEGGEVGKKVTFKEESDMINKELDKVKKEMYEQMKKEIKKLEEDMKGYIEYIEKKWESRLEAVNEKMEKAMETMKEIREKTEEREIAEKESRGSDGLSERSGFTTRTWQSSWGGSTSRGSGDRLSFREVDKIKKLVADKDREERKNNITIKGMALRERDRIEKEDIEKWLKQKIDVECKVMSCRQSGTVTIAKIESEEKKKEIMRNKHKLRGEKFYIENDLSWEERRTQEQITRWAKEQKAKGEEVKA